jgi:putative chitinase
MALKNLQTKIGITPDGVFGPATLKAAVQYYKLDAIQGAHFFGQTSHESEGFAIFSENLNYRAETLTQIWPHLFPADIATIYAHQTEKIANRAYANRMGNGDENSGDGWKFRGRGAIQLTGKESYQLFTNHIGVPEIMNNPDLVATDYAFESALYFFEKNGLWNICEKGVSEPIILELTKRINGGTNGLDDRTAKTEKFYSELK